MSKTVLRLARRYALNVAVGLDQLVNALVGGAPDETLSSVLGKAARGDYGPTAAQATAPLRGLVDLVFLALGEKNHCRASIEHDEGAESLWRMISADNRE